MKKYFALMLAVLFGLGTIGCDDKPKASEKPSEATPVKPSEKALQR